jgi:hypothetical protein
LTEQDRVRIALPGQDDFKDFPKLLEYHLKAGRRAFAVFDRTLWDRLAVTTLANYQITPVLELRGGRLVLCEISRRTGGQDGKAPCMCGNRAICRLWPAGWVVDRATPL